MVNLNLWRFCKTVKVMELLALNMILFNKLGEEGACTIFELILTVIAIPILLLSFGQVKANKNSAT